MSYLKSRPEPTRLREIFTMFPHHCRPLLEFHELVLRGPSELTPAERELIFAYGSALNACRFCHDSHRFIAEELAVDPALFAALLADVETAPVSPWLKPVLRYVRKLTETPSRMTQADADAIYAAGWSERTLFDLALLTGLFNLMNRLVDGLGVEATEAENRESARRLSTIGYAGTAKMLTVDR
jgi:uncharacterized peroxidase-related enzyme